MTSGIVKYPIANQVFGAGKTSLADNAFYFNNAHVRSVFEEFSRKNDLASESLPHNFPAHATFSDWNLDRFFKSLVTVSIRLDSLPKFPKHFTLSDRLSWMMWICAFKQLFPSVPSKKSVEFLEFRENAYILNNPRECYRVLVEMIQAPIFFYFDEIQYLEQEQSWPKELFGLPSTGSPLNADSIALAKHKRFMMDVSALLRDGVPFMSVGKSKVICDIDRSMFTSPCIRERILLPAFSFSDLDDIITNGHFKNARFLTSFAFDQVPADLLESAKADFIHWLRDLTGGIPRFTNECLLYLLNRNFKISNFAVEKSAYTGDLMNLIKCLFKSTELQLTVTSEYFKEVSRIALLSESVDLNANIVVGDNKSMTIGDLVDSYQLLVEEIPSEVPSGESLADRRRYRIVMPWFWLERLIGGDFYGLSAFKDPSKYLDKGRALEWFCAERIVHWGAYSSILKTEPLEHFWPWIKGSILEGIHFAQATIEEGPVVNSPEAVEAMLSRLLDQRRNKPVIYFPARKSSSPDLVHLISIANETAKLLCIECKNQKSSFSDVGLQNGLSQLDSTISAVTQMAKKTSASLKLEIMYMVVCTGPVAVTDAGTVTTVTRAGVEVQVLMLSNDQVNRLLGESSANALLALCG